MKEIIYNGVLIIGLILYMCIYSICGIPIEGAVLSFQGCTSRDDDVINLQFAGWFDRGDDGGYI